MNFFDPQSKLYIIDPMYMGFISASGPISLHH